VSEAPLLAVENLTVEFPIGGRWVPIVRGVSFEVGHREIVGLAGESGSGKSLTALALLRLVPAPGRIASGKIWLEGTDVLTMSASLLRRVRGGRVGLVFQEPASALNPVLTIGHQIVEAIQAHGKHTRREARREAARLLELVALADASSRLDDYPHQLSGGQRQRALIAMALAAGPRLLLADEPTTALDVTIQAQILELLARLRAELGLAVLLITHDLAVIAETCERLLVMYAGELVEQGSVQELFAQPAHPYTRGLLASLPRLGSPAPRGALPTIPGQVPTPGSLPDGCAFHPRCAHALASCARESPLTYTPGVDHRVRCVLAAPEHRQ
jgi:peptide/nickel transport system ATP-binding protein